LGLAVPRTDAFRQVVYTAREGRNRVVTFRSASELRVVAGSEAVARLAFRREQIDGLAARRYDPLSNMHKGGNAAIATSWRAMGTVEIDTGREGSRPRRSPFGGWLPHSNRLMQVPGV